MDDKTRELIELLATKLGTKAVELSEHLVNHTYMCGWMQLAAGILMLCVGASLAIVSRRLHKGDSYNNEPSVVTAILAAMFGALGAVMSLIAITNIAEPVGATIKGLL
ncbi:hypothetical protein LCGC14_0817160 [marine sediment metagenome]|uniref:Uncharacterized protein n=1 Tax=marine sediment metagenome TaxID=412755 RepID=A0A0F9PJU0_9ZZZZ